MTEFGIGSPIADAPPRPAVAPSSQSSAPPPALDRQPSPWYAASRGAEVVTPERESARNAAHRRLTADCWMCPTAAYLSILDSCAAMLMPEARLVQIYALSIRTPPQLKTF